MFIAMEIKELQEDNNGVLEFFEFSNENVGDGVPE